MFVAVVLCAFGGALGAPVQYSDTRFDGLELSSILKNDELYIQLFQCLIGRGKCSPDWELLKDAVPGALLDNCVDCSEKQKISMKTLLAHLVHHKPEDMRLLEGEFDPDGSYRKSLEKLDKDEEEKQTNVIQTKRAARLKDVEILEKVKRIK
uniref:Chemosensory protein 4 n=1 Tax=Cyrtorhinus lividipennis TaxID=1032904 RepID=A0A1W6AWI6_9HEMI|nr:chemosensory protein 4 [Cyrtorhinus lividipennis]